jgi:hypothetical protein
MAPFLFNFFFSSGAIFFCFLEVGRLGIGRLGFGYESFFFGDWEELQMEHLLHTKVLTIILHLVPPCKWCLSPKGFIPLFALGAQSFSLEFSPKAR